MVSITLLVVTVSAPVVEKPARSPCRVVTQFDYYTYSDHRHTYSPMKAKLTITVDEELIPEAKRHARSCGQSLSQLVEDGLRRAIAERDTGFAQRWRGRFRAARGEDARFAHLAKKYLDP